jgi:hypothetical protein
VAGVISQCAGNARWPITGPFHLTMTQKLAQSLSVSIQLGDGWFLLNSTFYFRPFLPAAIHDGYA